MSRSVVLVAVVAAALALASSGFAGGSVATGHTFMPPASGNLGIQSAAPTKALPTQASTLPFTGLSLLGIGLVGAVLIGGGIAMRSSTRRSR